MTIKLIIIQLRNRHELFFFPKYDIKKGFSIRKNEFLYKAWEHIFLLTHRVTLIANQYLLGEMILKFFKIS